MKKETNNKKLLLYQAVIDLIEDGVDINTIKVIDITQRAGIGKGTAYEYFNSKEELVIQALFYNMEEHMKKLQNELLAQPDFQSMIRTVLHWILENPCKRRSSVQFFYLLDNSAKTLREEICHLAKSKKELLENLLDILCSQAAREGMLSPALDADYAHIAMFSNFVTYFFYLSHWKKADKSLEEIQEFFYRNLCGLLCIEK